MDFAFATTQLRGICESRRKAAGAFGVMAALELGQKLAELEASETVCKFEETFGPLVELSPTGRALPLGCGFRLIFESGHVSIPKTVTGEVDWGQVTKIKITALEAIND